MAAKKKTAKKVASKKATKRAAPSRPCVKCKKPVHPRSKECKACGAKQPQAKKSAKRTVAKKTVAKKTANKAANKAASVYAQIATVAGDIEVMERKLAAKKTELKNLSNKV
jgi:hypothetical protein